MAKLLVTGGAGFIGSNFIRYWLKRHADDEIVNFDVLTYAGNLTNLEDFADDSRYSFVKGDIRNREQVREAMRGVDTVVHFAAESHVDRSVMNPSEFVETNVLGTQILLEEASAAKAGRFHHVSTDEVFGSLPLNSEERFSELTPYAPSSPYSASKASSDMLVRAFGHTFGLPFTISNCSNNYGPYQFPEKLIPLMILNAVADKPLPVYGDGLNVRDWIHVDDHARGIELVLEKGKIGETYCVGGNAERTNLEVVKEILKAVGKPESLISFVTDRPGHDLRYAIDDTKIRTELGYEPAHTFEAGLAETVAWYQKNEAWLNSVVTKDYQNYYETQYAGR